MEPRELCWEERSPCDTEERFMLDSAIRLGLFSLYIVLRHLCSITNEGKPFILSGWLVKCTGCAGLYQSARPLFNCRIVFDTGVMVLWNRLSL